jgi:hypothetical protein
MSGTSANLPLGRRELSLLIFWNQEFQYDANGVNDFSLAEYFNGTVDAMNTITATCRDCDMAVNVLGMTQGNAYRKCPGSNFSDCLSDIWINHKDHPCNLTTETFPECYFSTENIYEIIKALPVRSVLMIYSNQGIYDYTNQTEVDKIINIAIIKRIQVRYHSSPDRQTIFIIYIH